MPDGLTVDASGFIWSAQWYGSQVVRYDPDGKVDLAIYARPHVIGEETVAFVMGDPLSHKNVTANPHAAYLFLRGRYKGWMHLTRTLRDRSRN
jgi:sugar lactone lactonase YvrE